MAADYYVDSHEWPASREQLVNQMTKMVEREKEKLPVTELVDAANFFEPFTIVECKKKGENLVLHFAFKLNEKKYERRVTLHPGPTTDEILQAASD